MSDIGTTSWSETDASNSTPAPQGWPEGMAPSGVNDSGRAMMGATKRFWDRINGTIQATNVVNDYTLAYGVNDSSLFQGAVYTFRAAAANTGAATLNVGDGSGPHAIVRHGPTATVPLTASDLVAGGYYSVAWDSVSSQFVLLGGLPAAAVSSASADLIASLRSVSACVTADIRSASLVLKADLTSVSAVIKADISSVSAVITTAFTADLRSASAVIKADIASVSSVITAAFTAADRSVSACITADLRSMSLVLKADLASVSSVLTTAFTAADRSVSACITADLRSMSLVLKADLASVSSVLQASINNVSATVATIFNQWLFSESQIRVKVGSAILANSAWTNGSLLGSVVAFAGITFTAAFPTACIAAFVINADPAAMSIVSRLAVGPPISTTGITVYREGGTTGVTVRVNWLAFGT